MKTFNLTPRRRLKLYEYCLDYLENKSYNGICVIIKIALNNIFNLSIADMINFDIHPMINGTEKYIEFHKFKKPELLWFDNNEERKEALRQMIKEVKLLIK